MDDDSWEKLADAPEEVVKKPVIVANINKWEGEDEDDVKDSWEDEDEEAKEEEEKSVDDAQVVKKAKPQKNLKKTIEEKERLRQQQEEEKAREREANMTPEEKLAEKLRLQKIQEESDLRTAMETFGVTEIDAAQPKTKAELTELADAISKKVSQFKNLSDFPGFLEELVRNVCANLNSSDLQKIKKTVDNMYAEKQKLEKEQKNKKSSKGKTKVNLRIESDSANIKEAYGNDYYESYDYDDFM